METNLIKIYNSRDVNIGASRVFKTEQEMITLNDINCDIYDRTNNRIILHTKIENKKIILYNTNSPSPMEIGKFVFDEKESTQSLYVYRMENDKQTS